VFTAFVIRVRFFVGTGCDEAEREIGVGGTIGCLRLTTIVVVNNGHKNKLEISNGSWSCDSDVLSPTVFVSVYLTRALHIRINAIVMITYSKRQRLTKSKADHNLALEASIDNHAGRKRLNADTKDRPSKRRKSAQASSCVRVALLHLCSFVAYLVNDGSGIICNAPSNKRGTRAGI